MGLGLLAMLSGMIFSVVRVSMTTAVFAQRTQMENDEVNRYISLCRHTFQSLPVTAILTLKITDSTQPVKQELAFSAAPDAFSFGINPMSYKDTTLGLRPDVAATEASTLGQQLYYLALSRPDIIPKDPNNPGGIAQTTGAGDVAAPDDQGRHWMPLIRNVTSLYWRFYKAQDDTWVEEWSSVDLPQLVEMNLQLSERSMPQRVVFALPTTKLTAANPALAPKTTTTTTTGSGGQQQQQGGQGGNNNAGGGQRGEGGGRGRGEGGEMRGGEGGQRGPGGGGPPQGGGERPGGGGQNSAQPGGSGGGSNRASSGGGGR